MYKELTIHFGTKKGRAFLQHGFHPNLPPTQRMHKHNYAEIHIVAGGELVMFIDDENYTLKDGTLLLIPRETFHYCIKKDKTAVHSAFQIDYNASDFFACDISPDTISDFFDEIKENVHACNYTKIAAYISLFCSYFCDDNRAVAKGVTDYGFLVREFFQRQYPENVRLCDLAKILNVCERQAERLVLEYTGRTFRDELTYTRVTAAKQLLKRKQMSLQEIATYVGYRSYAGFWKAMKKYQ